MVKVIPSTSPQQDISAVAERFEAAKSAERIHVDFIDGIYVENETVLPREVKELTTDSKLDFHLMVDEPSGWMLKNIVPRQADRIVAQIERMTTLQLDFVRVAKDLATTSGVAIDLETPVDRIEREVLEEADVILVMSVKAGFGGQKFEKSALEKVEALNTLRKENGYSYTICVDGGITKDNIKSVVDAGADEVCVGRRLFDGDLAANMREYQKAAE